MKPESGLKNNFARARDFKAPSSVTITSVFPLPGGGIQFGFNVPAGANYVVESSGDLFNWRTNKAGPRREKPRAPICNNGSSAVLGGTVMLFAL